MHRHQFCLRSAIAVGVICALAVAGCSGIPSVPPCFGQDGRCERAVALARGALEDADLDAAVLTTRVDPERDCDELTAYRDDLQCPRDLEYSVEVTFTLAGMPDPVVVDVADWTTTDLHVWQMRGVPPH